MATSKVTNLSILDDAVRTAGIQDAAVTTAKTSGVPTLFLPTAQPIIINGDMAVAQRNSGTVAQSDGSNEGYATVDRMQTTFGNSAGGTITTSRDNEAPTGFGQSMKFDITGADASVGATHIVYSEHTIEAQVIRNSGWNYTSSSSYLTLSFQIRSSKTGTYCVFFQTNDGTAYMYTAEYTISSADTWEKKVITLPGNSNLTFNNDNGKGLIVAWVWAVGTDRDGTADAWTTGNAYGTSNQVNFLDSTSNIAYITGVQLEVGEYTSSDLPPFRHESYGDNLARCLRYYYRNNGRSGFGAGTGFLQDGLVKAYIYHTMPVPPRTEMSFSLSSTSADSIITIDGKASDNVTSIGATHSDAFPYKDYEFNFVTDGTAITDKCGMGVRINASEYIECSAELT